MALLGGAYLFNLLCAVVPCQGKWAPINSYIDAKAETAKAGRALLENETFVIDPHPIVQTLSGDVQGYSMGSVTGRRVFAFEGIPYAEPPNTRDRRFRAPTPKRRWEGVLRCFKTKPNCLQINALSGFMVSGSEDCLYLSIFTPVVPTNSSKNDLLPVVVFFHGGSYYFGGGGEYGPAYLANKDVILVTVTYRQGVLGFLSTGDEQSPGNYGLKDQALALKWVHKNIEKFGGQNSKVTLMGQSSGGCSAHLHMVANKTRNYFQNAYTLSGSGFVHWALHSREEAHKLTVRFAKLFLCPTSSNRRMMNCLRSKNPAFLVSFQVQLFEIMPLPIVLFSPTIESRDSPDAFLTETPEEAYKRGTVAKKPWVVSVLTQEGHTSVYMLRLTARLGQVKRHMNQFLPILLDYKKFFGKGEKSDEVTEKIWNFYYGNTKHEDAADDFLSDMATDRYFMVGIQKGIQAHSEIAPTYPLLFAFKGRFNSGAHLYGANKAETGLGHCEDLYYYFNASIYADGYKRSEPEYEVTQVVTSFLYNFAKYNEPLYTDATGNDVRIWDAVENPETIRFLRIKNDVVKMIGNPYKSRVKFWESLEFNDTTKWETKNTNDINKI